MLDLPLLGQRLCKVGTDPRGSTCDQNVLSVKIASVHFRIEIIVGQCR